MYIFCPDDHLLEINQRYLDHTDYTDIITFPYNYEPIEAEIYISLGRVHENAANFGVTPKEELLRVIVHGLLHMCGYDDQKDTDKAQMRKLEDKFIKKAIDA